MEQPTSPLYAAVLGGWVGGSVGSLHIGYGLHRPCRWHSTRGRGFYTVGEAGVDSVRAVSYRFESHRFLTPPLEPQLAII